MKFTIFRKFLSLVLTISIFLASFLPLFNAHALPLIPKAEAADSCSVGTLGDLRSYLSSRVGGVALDQAAVFLADMSDITGAYYDADQDRVVFVGQKGSASIPKFDKDDLAVAIRALVFNNNIPSVSMEFKDPNNAFGDPNLNVLYYGGIEDTRFGQVLVDADYDMKIYSHGYDENGNRVVSSVPGYKSFFDRWIEKIQGKTPKTSNYSRFWISPQLVSLKKDDSAKAFVFDTVKMQIETEGLRPDNDPEWNQAAIEFSAQQTDLYDQFAQETPSYYQAKQLARIVGVVKWIKDNSIVNNFEWARDYQPKYVATPREIKRLTTPYVSNGTSSTWAITGGVVYDEPNVYTPDGILASSIKTSSEAVGTPTEANHWTFTNNGQQYEAVAVAANAFRSLGAYATISTDMSFPTVGDLTLAFGRSYSSFSGGQKGIGRGWDFMPAKLYDNKTGWYVNCTSGAVGKHPWKLGFITQGGISETFTYTSCTAGYSSDKPEYHSKLLHNSDGTFTARLKDQTEYLFDVNFRLTAIRDKNGNTISYIYDVNGKITSIKDSQNHQLIISYNSVGLISSVADWAGRSVQYGYDLQSNLTSVSDPRGGITRYEYDSNNKLTKVINRLGQSIIENTYTPEAKIASQKDAAGTAVNFTYDEATKTISAVDNNGRTGKMLYDDKTRVLENTDPLNGIIKYTYGNEYAPLTITDKKGNKLTYTYDPNGNPTSVTIPTSKKISYEYNTNNFITRILDGRYGITSKETKFTYDAKNNITQTSEAGRLTNFTYDPLGQMLTLTDPLNQKTTWTRDSFGNSLTLADHLNNTTSYDYDSLARLAKSTDGEGKIVSFSYDQNNNVISQTDGSGTYNYQYDSENRLQKETKPNGAITEYFYTAAGGITFVKDALNNTTSYGYDGYLNLISQKDALDRTTSYAYDKLNRTTQETTALGNETKWEYDQNGNITKRTDANNNSTAYTYDSLNRLTKITYPNATSVSNVYDDRNNLTKITDLVGITSFTYDVFDRLTQATNPFSKSITYAYDNADNLTKITYPDSKSVSYTFDGASRLTSVSDWNIGKTNYSYQKNGLVASKSLPNGIVGNYTYNIANQLVSLVYEKAGTILAKFVYERDSLGNVTKAIEEGSFFTAITPTPTPTPTPVPALTPVIRASSSGSSSSALILNKPTGTVDGDLLIMTASADLSASESVTYTIPSGWTQLLANTRSDASSAGNNLQVWYKIASSEPANYTITPDHTNLIGGSIIRINGHNSQNPIDVTDVKASLTGEASTPSVTTTINNDLVLRLATWDQSKILNAIPSGHTKIYHVDVSGHDSWGGYKEQATAGSVGVAQLDLSGGSPYVGFTVAIKPGGGSNPTPTPTPTATPTPTPTPTPTSTPTPTPTPGSGSGATPIVRSSSSGSVSTGGLTLTKPTGTVNGDLLIMTASADLSASEDVTYSIPSGWTQLLVNTRSDASSAGNNLQAWYKVATSSEPSDYTITPDHSNLIGGSIIRIDGQASSSLIDVDNVTASLTGEASAPSVTTTANNALVLRLVTWDQSKTVNAIPSGHTQAYHVDVSGHDNWGGYKEQTTAGSTGVGQLDLSSGAPYVGYTVAIKPQLLSTTGQFDKFIASLGLKTIAKLFSISTANAQTPPTQFTTNYTYDVIGRLTSATYPDTAQYSYTLDKVGNRTTQTVNSTAINYTYNNDNQLTQIGADALTYNANGDTISRASGSSNRQFAYDFEDRLTSFTAENGTQTSYAYDGLGNRLQKTVGGTTTRFVNDYSGDLSKVIAETNSLNTIQNWYVYGLELISQGTTASSSRLYHLQDGLGNVRFVSNSTGAKVKSYDYDPFGNIRSSSGTAANNYQFSTEQLDPESSMYFLRARYYDPSVGRFISKDPVKGTLTIPQTLNPYSYAGNNPINLSDPSGEQAVLTWIQQNMPTFTRWGQNIAQVCQKFLSKPSNLDLSEHAVDAMTKRGISPNQVQGVIKSGETFKYYHEGVWKTGYYDAASKIFVGVGDKITTVIDDVNWNYINNLKNAKP